MSIFPYQRHLRKFAILFSLPLVIAALVLMVVAIARSPVWQPLVETDLGADSADQTVPDPSLGRAHSSEPKFVKTTDEVNVWYWENRAAISEDAGNASWAVLRATVNGELSDESSVAEKAVEERAEAAAMANLDKKKVKLLADLEKTPTGIPAPPIYKVRSEKEHLDEIRESVRTGK